MGLRVALEECSETPAINVQFPKPTIERNSTKAANENPQKN
jgi:hypothetical protein